MDDRSERLQYKIREAQLQKVPYMLVCGKREVENRTVAVRLRSGDEVVDIDVVPGPSQIRNSNSYSLAAQITASGGEAIPLPIAPDEPARLRELLSEAFDSDLVLIAGGVSMGRYDLVEPELAAQFGERREQVQRRSGGEKQGKQRVLLCTRSLDVVSLAHDRFGEQIGAQFRARDAGRSLYRRDPVGRHAVPI